MALLTVAAGSGATMMPSDSVHVQRLDPILADPRIEFAGLPPVIPMWVSPSCLSKKSCVPFVGSDRVVGCRFRSEGDPGRGLYVPGIREGAHYGTGVLGHGCEHFTASR
jgi:hypothetical protein